MIKLINRVIFIKLKKRKVFVMKKKFFYLAAAAGSMLFAAGCQSTAAPEKFDPPRTTAVRASGAIKVDGKLDEKCWQNAPEYVLGQVFTAGGEHPVVQKVVAKDKFEKMYVKCLYDDKYLYIACRAEDGDVISHNRQDQEFLFRDCDLIEVFIKPVKANYYWELYATAAGNKSSCFYPSAGTLINSAINKENLMPGLLVGSTVQGTLNYWQDSDKSWTSEMAVPLKELTKYGMPFGPGSQWTIFFARYNYSKDFRKWQYSGYPVPPVLSSHLLENYSPIDFK